MQELCGKIGLGCVGLTAMSSKRDAIHLLNHAFEAGIRHFDTAPAYGMGVSERILGDFINGKRTNITITSKFGITPPALARPAPFLGHIKKALKRIPLLDRKARQIVSSGFKNRDFSPQSARKSLESSLRALKTDYLDILLFHEATIEDVVESGVLDYLDSVIAAGQVRYIGVGSDHAKIIGHEACFPSAVKLLQFDSGVAEPNINQIDNAAGRFLITHSAFKKLPTISAALRGDNHFVTSFNQKHGINLSSPGVVASLMLSWSIRSNPRGCVLFGTTSVSHIDANLAAVEEMTDRAEALMEFSDYIASAT